MPSVEYKGVTYSSPRAFAKAHCDGSYRAVVRIASRIEKLCWTPEQALEREKTHPISDTRIYKPGEAKGSRPGKIRGLKP